MRFFAPQKIKFDERTVNVECDNAQGMLKDVVKKI